MAIENFDPKEWSRQFLKSLEPLNFSRTTRDYLDPETGDARDTGIIELCDLCGRPLPTGVLWIHTECADAENADDRITAIEDAIEELDR